MIFIDSNIVIELLNAAGTDAEIATTIAEMLAERRADGETLVCNLVVVAEVAAGLAQPDELPTALASMSIAVLDLDVATAIRAAKAFREYRDRGGIRASILPDFLIAAHAATLGADLMTRDRRIAGYFADLTLITPETQP